MKMQSDAEHQENDPDLGQLLGQMHISHESRSVRADEHARQ